MDAVSVPGRAGAADTGRGAAETGSNDGRQPGITADGPNPRCAGPPPYMKPGGWPTRQTHKTCLKNLHHEDIHQLDYKHTTSNMTTQQVSVLYLLLNTPVYKHLAHIHMYFENDCENKGGDVKIFITVLIKQKSRFVSKLEQGVTATEIIITITTFIPH